MMSNTYLWGFTDESAESETFFYYRHISECTTFRKKAGQASLNFFQEKKNWLMEVKWAFHFWLPRAGRSRWSSLVPSHAQFKYEHILQRWKTSPALFTLKGLWLDLPAWILGQLHILWTSVPDPLFRLTARGMENTQVSCKTKPKCSICMELPNTDVGSKDIRMAIHPNCTWNILCSVREEAAFMCWQSNEKRPEFVPGARTRGKSETSTEVKFLSETNPSTGHI